MPYLDYNATTPVDKRVVQSMIPIFEQKFGNPSSHNHNTGRMANYLVDEARKSVANIIVVQSMNLNKSLEIHLAIITILEEWQII